MTLREAFEQREAKFISPFGCFSAKSKGRIHAEAPCPIRTAFQVDKDRILYCNAFRRPQQEKAGVRCDGRHDGSVRAFTLCQDFFPDQVV